MGIFEYVLWCIHIREYTGLTITMAKGITIISINLNVGKEKQPN